jgi:hypothetical protein
MIYFLFFGKKRFWGLIFFMEIILTGGPHNEAASEDYFLLAEHIRQPPSKTIFASGPHMVAASEDDFR